MTASASKLAKTLKLKGAGKLDNKSLPAGILTARTNLSTDSADNELNLEVLMPALVSDMLSLGRPLSCPWWHSAEVTESKRSLCQSRSRQGWHSRCQ